MKFSLIDQFSPFQQTLEMQFKNNICSIKKKSTLEKSKKISLEKSDGCYFLLK